MSDEREIMEVDILFVGGGISCLSGALHLSNLIRNHNKEVAKTGTGRALDEIMIAVLEKGAYPGAHGISGAVMDPVALKELVPDFQEQDIPLESAVTKETVAFLTEKFCVKSPVTPPPLNNHGNYVVSVSRLNEWLGNRVQENGVDIFAGFAGTEVLYDDSRVIGVRTGDKGIDSDGDKKSNYEPGIDLHAKVTVFGEGSRGSLTRTLIKKLNLDAGKNPQSYVVGVKEVWELPEGRVEPGSVMHTLGYPLESDTYGGGFIYGMKNNMVSIGLLTGLDYKDPLLDPHREFQKFKLHPYISRLLQDGKLVQYGAKTAPVGGYFSVPRLCFDGGLIIGDSANLFVSQKLKGIHTAMKSGMIAAETILQSLLKEDFSESGLQSYKRAVNESYIGHELYKARNWHQAFDKGLLMAMIKGGLQYVLGGSIIRSRLNTISDHAHLQTVVSRYGTESPSENQRGDIKYDGRLLFDKETDVYHSGSTHEESQPPHLKILDMSICFDRCAKEYQNPCVRFCPANVYEVAENEESKKPEMKLNFSNCVHCKTCDIKDPYENILWVPPEGGGGPKYTMM